LKTNPIDSQLSGDSRDFFMTALGGKCVNITRVEDVEGEYRVWFPIDTRLDGVVLVRPDFYIFGRASVGQVNGLVHDLRVKMGAA